jgi:hydrogenase expression/formation protein HypC
MCLGIPGQVLEMPEAGGHLAKVDVAGVRRLINVELVKEDGLAIGDWVLIHVGFAMSIIDEEEANSTFEGLQMMGQVWFDDMDALRGSTAHSDPQEEVDEQVLTPETITGGA